MWLVSANILRVMPDILERQVLKLIPDFFFNNWEKRGPSN